jgi:hypothetical protein
MAAISIAPDDHSVWLEIPAAFTAAAQPGSAH